MTEKALDKAYISGPINTEIEGVNLRERKNRFYRCEAFMVGQGKFQPVNPLRIGACQEGQCAVRDGEVLDGHTWRCWLRYDLRALLRCEAMIMLPGFEFSKGAQLEMHVASALEMPFYYADEHGRFEA